MAQNDGTGSGVIGHLSLFTAQPKAPAHAPARASGWAVNDEVDKLAIWFRHFHVMG